MISILAFLLLVSGAIGAGSMAVQVSGVRKNMTIAEDIIISLTLGTGLIGWLMFFPGVAGYLSTPVVATILIISCIGLVLLWRRYASDETHNTYIGFSFVEKLLILGVMIAMGFDLFEAYAPQADADTMAYHFGTPALFLRHGVIEFIPRALDGGIPLLQQMGYAAGLSIGGEFTANLWLGLTGWTVGAMTFVVTSRLASRPWALAAILLIMTIPAIVYGGGTGQVEARTAAYVILAAYAVYVAIKEDSIGFIWIAAIATGLFFGSKYTGLILGFACGLTLLVQSSSRLKHASIFSIIAIAVGCQWYAFNFYHTGDPIFPVLWGVVDYPAGFPWSDIQSNHIRELYGRSESPVTQNLFWFIAYPFVATLDPMARFESARVGLGVIWLVLVPIAALGVWKLKRRVLRSAPATFLMICVVFYAVWFFFGPSQRVRHLLPVYPLLVIALVILSHHALRHWNALSIPCAIAVIVVASVQLGGQFVFSIKYLDFALSRASASTFLKNNIVGYDVTTILNDLIKENDRVLVTDRQWLYRLRVPYFYAHPDLQSQVILRPNESDPAQFMKQLHSNQINYVVVSQSYLNKTGRDSPLQIYMQLLDQKSCAQLVEKLEAPMWASRTLKDSGSRTQTYSIYKIDQNTCTLR